jgi:uncharacterized protein with HEPN domain
MSKDDALRLRHMLEAAREAITFAIGRTAKDLTCDRMLLLSLVKEIEIIGEAARHVSTETRARITEVPWLDVTGMRNRLTHGYFDWDIDEVWSTVSSDLPELVRALEAVLPPKA